MSMGARMSRSLVLPCALLVYRGTRDLTRGAGGEEMLVEERFGEGGGGECLLCAINVQGMLSCYFS